MIKWSRFKKIIAGDLNTNFTGLADGTEIQDGVIKARHFKVGIWYEVGAGNNPAYQNSWVAYGGTTYYGAYFMLDAQGFVHLRGLVKSGTLNATIFTLPEGFRPAYRHLFPVQCNNQIARLDTEPDGEVKCYSASNAYVSLNGIKFQAGG